MVSYNTNLRSWGATGSEPPSDYKYTANESPIDDFDNWFNDNVIDDLLHLTDLTNARIESGKGLSGNEPSSPETSHIYHDQDNERLEVWDASLTSWRGLLYKDEKYTDNNARSAIEAGNLNKIDGINSHRIRFDSDANYIEITDQSNNRSDIVTQNTYINSLNGGTWLGSLSPSDIGALNSSNYNPVSDVNAETSLTVDITGDADTLDGNHASDLGSGASDSGTQVLATATDFNFGTGLSVTDDADGTVTINGTVSVPIDSVNGQTGDTLVNMNGYDIYITDTEPTGASQGDIWIDNTEAFN